MTRPDPEPISVYDFEDYRAFLDAWLREKRVRSVRALASKLGVSASYISMVRRGERNLKVEHARHWATGLRLDDYEQDYFEAMVRSQHGATDDARRKAQRAVDAARAWRRAIQREAALRLWSNWYVIAIIEFAKCEGFKADPEWIASHMVPRISVEEAESALELLREMGLIVESDGEVEVVDAPTSTGQNVSNEALSNALVRAHKSWLKNAVDALERPSDERFLGHVIFSMDDSRISEVVDVVRQLQIEAAEAGSQQAPKRVYELGVALVPRSEPPELE